MCEHRSSTPSGPLPRSPLNFKHNLLKQGTGTADHLTLLRLFSIERVIRGVSVIELAKNHELCDKSNNASTRFFEVRVY